MGTLVYYQYRQDQSRSGKEGMDEAKYLTAAKEKRISYMTKTDYTRTRHGHPNETGKRSRPCKPHRSIVWGMDWQAGGEANEKVWCPTSIVECLHPDLKFQLASASGKRRAWG